MEVPHEGEEVGVPITQDCLVATLKAVAPKSIFLVEVGRVALLDSLHDLRQWSSVCFYQEMDVVWHQNISVHVESIALMISP
jgi:hypothetical protein